MNRAAWSEFHGDETGLLITFRPQGVPWSVAHASASENQGICLTETDDRRKTGDLHY